MLVLSRCSFVALATMLVIPCGIVNSIEVRADDRPNIVFLLTDNHRWDALGCYGNGIIQTPHIDQLAARGTRFTSAFCTTSICAASRASIFNGQYRKRHGFTFQRPDIPAAAMRHSYPAVLRRAGYRTGFVGKLGLDVRDGVVNALFDFAKLSLANSRRNPYYKPGPDGTLRHVTRINGDHAVDFLRSCTPDQPFCLSVSFSAPHPEDDHPDQYIFDRELATLYADVSIPSPAVSAPHFFEQLPEFIRISLNRQRWFRRFDTPAKYQRMMKGMYRLITGVDRQVGRIVQALNEFDLADNTVIIMTADNGLMAGEHGLTGIWLMYEQSIRLPLIVYDPRQPASRAGGTIDEFALNVDIAPTILDLAGESPAPGMQGSSLVPLWKNDAIPWRKDFYYEHHFRPTWVPTDHGNIPSSEGVRTKDWKYVRYFAEEPVYEQLFDLQSDPLETNNLADKQEFEQRKQSLRSRMLELRGKVAALDLATIHRSADYRRLDRQELEQMQAVAGVAAHTLADDPDGDALRVGLLGNTLIERAAEHGYLEAELTRRWPHTDIVFHNLGWSGDTVDGQARVEFGPGEQNRRAWQRPDGALGDYGFKKILLQLSLASPDVLFIAYGSNVAFEGAEGLKRFRAGLDRLLRTLKPTEVRIVLVAPPPREIRESAREVFEEQNHWLQRVSQHLKTVATDRGHLFVDLFHKWPRPGTDTFRFTDNGIHLNQSGYQQFALIVSQELSQRLGTWRLHLTADGKLVTSSGTRVESIGSTPYGLRLSAIDDRLPSPLGESQQQKRTSLSRVVRIDKLEPAVYVLDIDGRRVARATAKQWALGVVINTGPDFDQVEQLQRVIREKNRLHFYGFRPQNKAYIHLFRSHERGHHAAELRQFSRLAQTREEEIARLRVPVSRHYELIREDDYPDDEVPNLSEPPRTESELERFTIADGLRVNLFAANPQISNPININWDAQGRMWVATSTVYPHLQPGQTPNDRIIILEDIDADGRADKHTVFADGLLVPQSVIPANGGAFVTQSTDLLFLRDTDGDGTADERRVVLTGFGNADVHHMIHGLRWGPGGKLFFNQSIYINSTVETPWGVQQVNGSCIWQLDPGTLRLEAFSRGLVNPWGHAFDRWGQSFATDGAGGDGIAYLFPDSAYSTHGAFARTLESLNPGRPKECGLEVISGRHLPRDWQGTLVTCDFRANRVTRYELTAEGSGYRSKLLGDVLSSTHRAFRPVDVKMGPDGALYIVDWYNEIIDHGEVDFHHPFRDKSHGRIWRLTARDRPLVRPPSLENASSEELLEALKLPEAWTRDQARRLLRERRDSSVAVAIQDWVEQLDPFQPEFEHHLLEALWVHQGIGKVSPSLLRRTFTSPDPRVRAAAVRVLAEWQTALPKAMSVLEDAVQDEHAQVRLEAVHALRRLGTRDAAELALRVLDRPVDEFLDFAAWLTARKLSATWIPPLRAGELVFDGDPGRLAFGLAAAEDASALPSLVRLLETTTLSPRQRQNALRTLAVFGGPDEQAMVVDELPSLPEKRAVSLLAALEQGRQTDQSPHNASRIAQLLDSPEQDVRLHALRLIGRWRVSAAAAQLLARIRDDTIQPVERLAAARGLVGVNAETGLQTLRDIAQSHGSPEIRITAAAGWTWEDTEGSAEFAAGLLTSLEATYDPSVLFEAFIGQRDGPQRLTTALSRRTSMTASVAAIGTRLARQSGRDLSSLVRVLARLGRLEPLPPRPSAEQIAELLSDVRADGDPHRGQAIYRRAELQCTKCHAIGGGGGLVGPDLSSLGGTARLDSLVVSLVDPSATIKEGYQTTTVLTGQGRLVSGRVHRQTDKQLVLRNAEDTLVRFSLPEIEEITTTPTSLMPLGLVKSLRRDELADLIRFLAALGREDDFRVPARNFVRRWQVLESTAKNFRELGDTAEALVLANSDVLKWSTRYSTVAGDLPLDDIPRTKLPEQRGVRFVRFSIRAKARETVELSITDPASLAAWIDGQRLRLSPRTRLSVHEGDNLVTLRVASRRQVPLAIEVRKP